jgi:hypothetical protein
MAHQPRDALAAHLHAGAAQLPVHAGGAVGAAAVGVGLTDLCRQRVVGEPRCRQA